MKFIQKKTEPSYLQEYRAKSRADGQNPKQAYDNFSGNDKQRLLQDLIEEQGYLCCYCMRRITASNPGTHIEHYQPRSKSESEKLSLDYKNLFAVCSGTSIVPVEKSTADSSVVYHCDGPQAKADKVLKSLNPGDRKCETVLRYLASGQIDSDDEAVQEDIVTLNLNDPRILVPNRKNLIQGLTKAIVLKFKKNQITQSYIQQQISKYQSRDDKNQYHEYCQVLIYHLNRYLSKATSK